MFYVQNILLALTLIAMYVCLKWYNFPFISRKEAEITAPAEHQLGITRHILHIGRRRYAGHRIGHRCLLGADLLAQGKDGVIELLVHGDVVIAAGQRAAAVDDLAVRR